MIENYIKKPVVIQAVQWNGDNVEEVQSFCGDNCMMGYSDIYFFFSIKTLEGDMYVSIGDYIIKGVNGEFYPCKPDIFEKTYERCK